MNETVRFWDDDLGQLTFRRIEESKKPNLLTYVLETKDGRFAKTQRLKRYDIGPRKVLTPMDIYNKKYEVQEMKQAMRELTKVLKTRHLPATGGRFVLTRIPGVNYAHP
jgi:hypothetical protein